MKVLIFMVSLMLLLPATANAAFGRMFPTLPGFTDPTSQQLADLAQTMLDFNTDDSDNLDVPAGFTYAGQFLDHDLTLDDTVQPTGPVNPVGLTNSRTFRLDLDSVYGGGPSRSPELYEADHQHFKIAESNGQPDLPRNDDGSAIISDGRNDENQIISQFHVAFLLAHNRLIDEGNNFQKARQIMTYNWQHIVLDQYLPAVLGQEAVDAALADSSLYDPGKNNDPMTPVEFSVAAFRFGHSEVRVAYELNEESGQIPVFIATGQDLRGGHPLGEGRQIEWGNFFDALTDPDDADGINHSRDIDTLISASLFQLPIPGAEAQGSNVLAFRNMVRAKFYSLPSYESVARALGVTPVGSPVFPGGTPLWFGILRESEITTGGKHVGPVGARIIASTIVGVLRADKDSILNNKKTVDTPFDATFEDLLVYAGLAEFPE